MLISEKLVRLKLNHNIHFIYVEQNFKNYVTETFKNK